jgi:hypothetical protein
MYVKVVSISLAGLAVIAGLLIVATFIYCSARNISSDRRGDASEEIGAAMLEAEEGRRPNGRADSWRISGGDEWIEDVLRRQREADRQWEGHERRGLASSGQNN